MGARNLRRTSVTGNLIARPPTPHLRHWARAVAGFTLIEMLVVVVLVAIIAAMVMLSLGRHGARATAMEAEALAALCNHLADAAVLSGQPYGLVLARDGYRVVVFDGHGWQLAPERHFREHLWPPPLYLEGPTVLPKLGVAPTALTPQALFLPSGAQPAALYSLASEAAAERYDIFNAAQGRYAAEVRP